MKIGDLLLKKGDKQKAIQTYTEVAEMFSRGGFDAKAVAIYKQILRTEEDSLEARTHLGECFQRMGLTSDALREFQEAFKICQKKELKREAFELLRRVASLDPSNVANRLNLADLFARENMMDDARREYTSLLEEVRRQTGVDLVLRVAEHMRRAFPDSREALDAVAWSKVQTGEHAEAVKLWKAALPKYPEDLPMRESLVAALEGAGDENGARKVWREIAELYKMRGDVEKSREILQRHGAIASFGGGEETTTPSLLLTDPTAAGADTLPDDADDIDLELDEPAASKAAPKRPDIVEKVAPGVRTPPMSKPAFKPEPPAAKPATSSPAELLAEARVALEFGDPSEAERLAKLVLEADPDSAQARKILAEIQGGSAPAPEEVEVDIEVEIESDEPEPEPEAEEEGIAIERNAHDEAEEPAPPRPAALRKPELASLGPNEDFDSLPDIEIVLEDEEDKDGQFASVEPPAELHDAPFAKPAAKAKPALAARSPSKPTPVIARPTPAAAEDEFDIEVEIDDGTGEAGPDLDQAPPKNKSAASEPDLGPDGDESLEFSEPLASESKEVGSFAQSSARIEETLSEADFYLEQGLVDEAERIYQSVLVIVPSHPKAMLRLGELDAKRGRGKGKKAAPQAAKPTDPLGDTMVREPNGDEALSIPDMPEPALAPRPKKEAPKPAPVAKPAAKPTPAKPVKVAKPAPPVVEEDTLPPVDEEPPEDLLATDDDASDSAPEFHPSELTAGMDEEEAAEAEEAAHAEDDFDLAAHLDEDDDSSGGTIGTLVGVGSLGKGFSDVFSAFKKGIQEQVSEGDADTHYDLAIAYKEMGLNEDAVRELETVLRTGSRAIEALSLMATCKLALGDAEAAAAHLEDALERAGDSDDSSVSLRYDLAEALLSAGREAEALEAFQKVSAADPNFRDVAERIARFG